MLMPSYADAFQVLLLQACDQGREQALFGDSARRAREVALPFMFGREFPSIYIEHPLIGDPFMDLTVLYSSIDDGSRIESPAAAGSDRVLDWFAGVQEDYPDISFGFELDTKSEELPAAAVHFQPRSHIELVEPFCEAVGEREKAALYLDMATRLEDVWPLSFFGLFKGRPDSPLRVCGYLSGRERVECAEDPERLASRFRAAGFTAYDKRMLEEACTLMKAAPGSLDFQMDVYPDGSIGPIFAFDVQFDIEQPEAVQAAFDQGRHAHVMSLLEGWGIADDRWKLSVDATFARALPVQLDDGSVGSYAFTLMPQWMKVRWVDGVLQPAKLYLLASGGLL